jgi:hypothetical protein
MTTKRCSMKRYFVLRVIVLMCAAQLQTYGWQGKDSGKILEGKVYTFVPETVYPLGMRPRQVTAEFALKIKADTIQCYLPYFGQATNIGYENQKSGTDFTSADFTYSESKGKKGAITLNILPHDNKDVREINVTYYNGSDFANVSMLFNQRQSISYRGRIMIRNISKE